MHSHLSVFAKFDFENRIHGANFLAYPPVVAGGNRANTLHYINNNQIIKVRGTGRELSPLRAQSVCQHSYFRDFYSS